MNSSTVKKIILASQSPRRKHLLSLLYPTFLVSPSHIDEDIPYDGNPEAYAGQLSASKAKEIAQQHSKGLVIGADTIVVLNNEVLGKPVNKANAIEILQKLSGNWHSVYTAVTLVEIESQKEISFVVQTRVQFKELDLDEITLYVETGSPMDKAGSYGIQDDWGSVFVSAINGDFYTVVGFPLHQFYQHIKQYFPAYLPQPA